MKTILILGLSLFLIACESAPTSNASKPVVKVLTDQDKVYLKRIEENGRLMFEKDVSAAKATDLVLEKINPSDYPNFVGWVTHPTDSGYTVTFYEKLESGFKVVADVIFSNKGLPTVFQLEPQRAVADFEVSMINARMVAVEKGINSCSEQFNTVILPSQNPEHWDVYILAATTDPKIVQVGGHTKVTVSKQDAQVIDVMPLAKSCLALNKSGQNLPEGTSLSALTVSHIVSPLPIVIHPYLNLLHDIPLAVSTERGLWMIREGSLNQIK